MKNLIYLLLGMFIMSGFQGAFKLMPVKQVAPKKTIVKSFDNWKKSEDVEEYMKERIREGFVVKTVAISEGETLNYVKAIIVMEKY